MTDLNNPKVQKILHSKAFAHLATIGPDGFHSSHEGLLLHGH